MIHSTLADFMAHRIEGTPLPCACSACAEQAKAWEAGRAAAAGAADALPTAFWTAQEARLQERTARAAPSLGRALAGSAALLVLGVGLALLLTRSTPPVVDDYETRYAAVQEALERPALGGLEACGVLLYENEEGGTAAEEAL